MSNAFMLLFTGLIAVATVAYVVVTCSLLRATKRSADAAKESADAAKLSAEAAKKSADIDAALHRPYLGVPEFKIHNAYDADIWAVRCEVRNFGTLPAAQVEYRVDIRRNGAPLGNPVQRTDCEIFPASAMTDFAQLCIDRNTRENLHTGNWILTGQVEIKYCAPEGTAYNHTAVFVFDRERQDFRPQSSKTASAKSPRGSA